jgi:hypothetical protein
MWYFFALIMIASYTANLVRITFRTKMFEKLVKITFRTKMFEKLVRITFK